MDFAWEEKAEPSYHGRNLTVDNRVLEMVKSLLNWLTHQNFEKVKDQLVSTIRGTPSALVLKSLVSSVFDMAVAVEDPRNLYGRLCVMLSCELPPVPSDERFGEETNFKRLLLDKCKMEFQIATMEDDGFRMAHGEDRLRVKLVRIVGLVAELFKCKVVAERTCQRIVQVLMEPTCPIERNIEAIYRFLSSIGKEVDTSSTFCRLFDAHSVGLENLIQNPSLSSRSRDMIFKLKYLRSNNLVKAKASGARIPLDADMNWELFHGEATTCIDAISNAYHAGELMPSSSRNFPATQYVKSIGDEVYGKLDTALENLRLSKQETCKEHMRRVEAEKDAIAAINKAAVLEGKYRDELRHRKETEDLLRRGKEELENTKQLLQSSIKERNDLLLQAQVLERKYSNELRVREEAEDALAKEREELEMMKELFQSYKKERDNMQVETGLLEGKYNDELRLRKETEDALAGERDELDKMRQLLETCKEEQHNMNLQAGVLQVKYNDECRLRKQIEVALARDKEEVENMKRILETSKEGRDKMEVERDNALKTVEELEKKLAEGQETETPSSFICPITQDVMKDPQVAADGFTYEAEAIRRWLEGGRDRSPMTNLSLSRRTLVPNLTLRSAIQDWLERHPPHG